MSTTPCEPYPDDAAYKTIALHCEKCDTYGECWLEYLRWEARGGYTLNAKHHHRVVTCTCAQHVTDWRERAALCGHVKECLLFHTNFVGVGNVP